ncbi:hypothetical protein [Shimia thalassica]|uniref:hypothetical protein n=1 Tax=Shimia thalassica TaxID=1715693 RepID=UPI0026E241FA|nr:hypothetical protein [Shimia thalassica]MDO6799394.1 hypothetical protein [Shimia thalassica]
MRDFDQMNTAEIARELRQQKTSHEMSEDEANGADWQDGYDAMVEAARALLNKIDL